MTTKQDVDAYVLATRCVKCGASKGEECRGHVPHGRFHTARQDQGASKWWTAQKRRLA